MSQLPQADWRIVPSTCTDEDAIDVPGFPRCPLQEQEGKSSAGLNQLQILNDTRMIYARRDFVPACMSISNLLV